MQSCTELSPSIYGILRPLLQRAGYTHWLVQDTVLRHYGAALCSRVALEATKIHDFPGTCMCRALVAAVVPVTIAGLTQRVVVGTTHLESVVPPNRCVDMDVVGCGRVGGWVPAFSPLLPLRPHHYIPVGTQV